MNDRKFHIVIAEDDEDDRFIIEESFMGNDQFGRVDTVRNGKELLDFLEGPNMPDIILTDINMPIMNGISALERIVQNEKLRNIPAFVYSTSINPVYQQTCLELGIKAYLIKPYELSGFSLIPQQILDML